MSGVRTAQGIDGLRHEAVLASEVVAGAVADARWARTEILLGRVADLPSPAAGEPTVPVDDVGNPFLFDPARPDEWDPRAAEVLDKIAEIGPKDPAARWRLRRENTARPTWRELIAAANARAFATARAIALRGEPDLLVVGKGDGMEHAERGALIRDCLASGRKVLVIDALDGVEQYMAVFGEAFWCASAMAIHDPDRVAAAVASGMVTTVADGDRVLISIDNAPWMPSEELGHLPEQVPSIVLPLTKSEYRAELSSLLMPSRDATIYGFSGNPFILNAILLGGASAGLQRSCRPWDAVIAPVAAAAGCWVARLDTQEHLDAEQVQSLLIESLINGEKVPALVLAKHEVAAKQLIRELGSTA